MQQGRLLDTVLLLLAVVIIGGMSSALRVLCLHGKGSNVGRMSAQLQPLRDYLGPRATLELLPAPFPLNEAAEQTSQWWILPEGQRSFEATSYKGDEESIALVEREIREKEIDVVVGHSQGSMLLACVLARRQQQQQQQQRPLGAILSSPAWPLPHKALLSSTEVQAFSVVHAVFTVGAADKINPPSHTREMAAVFAAREPSRTHLFEHEGGHVLPTSPAALAFFDDKIFSVLQRGA